MQGSYTRFAAMIATSTVLMYALTHLNTYRIDRVFWSETRFFMALLMGSMMSVVVLAYMRHIYERRGVNAAIVAASALVSFVALVLGA
jgi:hypothetical protein